MRPPLWQTEEKLKSLLRKVKEEREKVGLSLNIQNSKIRASGPSTSWQIDGETMEIVTDKQRHYFTNKGPSSQGYGFFSSHVWM